MATTIRKAKLGVEDIHTDDLGTGATTQTQKSDGTFRTVRKLNCSHIPTTAAIRTLSATAISVATAITELWALVLARLPLAGGTMSGAIAMGASKITGLANGTSSGDALHVGQVDGSTIEVAAGVVKVKDSGIVAAKLATDAVEEAKIKALAVTAGKIAADAVTTAKIANLNVTAAKLAWSPTQYVALAGISATYGGGGTSSAFAIAGALATDACVVTLRTSTNAVYVTKAVTTSDTLTVYFSADPGANTTVNYVITRAIA